MKKIIKIMTYIAIIILTASCIMSDEVSAQTVEKMELENAKKHFVNGEYRQAVRIYEQLLENNPNDISILKMKAIALSNSDDDLNSLKDFYKIIQQDPNNVIALTGMGVGFGNLGEYKEASAYLEKALNEDPDNVITKNYKKVIDEINIKYRYAPTEKTVSVTIENDGVVPIWVKNVVGLWGVEKIADEDFLNMLEYLIKNDIIKIPKENIFENTKELKMLSWVQGNLNTWSQGEIPNSEFFKNMNWLIENKFIKSDKISQKSQEEIDYEEYLFNKYLRDIKNNMSKEIRYIEYSNPSQDVIKKFLRDYQRWNFEQQVKNPSSDFPDPTYEIIDDTYIITYKIFINSQPAGLPLNHKSTLENTFEFWEGQELKTDKQDARVLFEITKLKHEANVWITWVVRDMGEGVLGHAHLGKGVVEVALGDYTCDGSFQLYDVESVETIMTHEIGHSIGLPHTNDRLNIMYPSYTPSYAYCLLN
jgi:tetratricopeptide (TPR) repeat protein